MSSPEGTHCGGVDCDARHRLPERWDEVQRRASNRERCTSKGAARPAATTPFVGRRDPDELAADTYRDDYTGSRMDW
ncbi:hypothetical protein [Kitasatospora sp. NPDC017646]|uniref:hypothetical protein n=1 Tax=Kitasatospora sp. NPDC017646 TaxID=3364024 RepID=UPI0037AE8C82